MEPSFVFSPPLVKGLRAKQLHHTATRSWVYNNDKRIVPPGGKRFYTLETENCVAVGAVGGAFSGRRAWGTRSIQTNGRKQGGAQRGSSNRKQLHEILMAYIYWQATVSSNSHRGPQGGGGRGGWGSSFWLTAPGWRGAHDTHTQTQKYTHTQACENMSGAGRGRPSHTSTCENVNSGNDNNVLICGMCEMLM